MCGICYMSQSAQVNTALIPCSSMLHSCGSNKTAKCHMLCTLNALHKDSISENETAKHGHPVAMAKTVHTPSDPKSSGGKDAHAKVTSKISMALIRLMRKTTLLLFTTTV